MLCNGGNSGSLILIGNGGTTGYTYSIVSQPSAGIATVSGNVVSGMKAGSYVLKVTDANGCEATTSATITQPALLTTQINVNQNVTCYNGNDGSIIAVVSNGTQPYIINWSNGSAGSVITGLHAGYYSVMVSDANNCIALGNATITQPNGPITANAGVNQTICSNESIGLTGIATNYNNILWTTNGTGTFNNATSLTTTYTPSASDIIDGQLQLYLTAYGNTSCEPVTDYMVLTIANGPIANAGNSLNIANTTVSYTVNDASASNYSSLLWTATGSGTLTDETTLTPTYTFGVGQTGTVTLTLTAYKTGSVCTNSISTKTISIVDAAIANAGNNETICQGSDVTLSSASATNATSILWTTSGTGTFNDASLLNPVYTPSLADIANGSTILTMLASNSTPSSSSSDNMTLFINPAPVVNNFNDIVICKGSYTQLGIVSQSNYNYSWTSNPVGFTSSISNPTVNPLTTTLYTFVVENAATLCTTTKNVLVSVNPLPTVITQNITVNLNSSGQADITPAMVNNGSYVLSPCNIESMTISKSHFTCNDIGNNNVLLTVTDQNGNAASATAIVTIVDNIAPIALAQNITVYLNNAGNASITASQIDNGSNDACGVTLSVSPNTFACANVGNNTVTLTVTDANGNTSTTTSIVNVVDNIAPIISAQNISINLNAAGTASITASQVNNGTSDACGVSFSVSPNTFNCTNVGNNTVTLTATDVNGNTSTTTAIVTVTDVTAPVVATQNIIVNLNASGTASITASQVDNGSSDVCGIASMSVSPNTFTCANVGNNTVTLTVTDVNSNVSTSTATVTIVDNIAPIALAQNITVYLNNAGNASITASQIDNGSNDACGVTLSVSPNTFACANVGNNTVTLTVTDANNNVSTTTAVVNVVDNIIPVITCPSAISVNNDANICGAAISIVPATATDNCTATGSISIVGTRSDALPLTAIYPVGTTTINWVATDANGNQNACNQQITVTDIQLPNIVSIGNKIRCANSVSNPNQYVVVGNEFDPNPITTTDNCGILSIVNNINSSNTLANQVFTGTTTIVWTVTDINGNVNSFSVNVLVNPIPTPAVTGVNEICANDTTSYLTQNNGSNFKYEWSVSGGNIISGANTPSVSVAWNNNCNFGIVSVKETNLTTNCYSIAIDTVIVHSLPTPVIIGDTNVFAGNSKVYHTSLVSGNLYSWSVVGGTISSGQGTASITVNWGSCGNCTTGLVSVTETTPFGCNTTSSINISIGLVTGSGKLTGKITYDNNNNTPLNGVNVQLIKDGVIIASTVSTTSINNVSGYYEFDNLAYGNYSIVASTNKPWGGVTATDALLIKLHSVGSISLTGLPLVAADVNASNAINATDALLIQLRIVGLSNQFNAGNWKFNNTPFVFNASDTTYNFKAICVGDVNKSYNTTGLKQATSYNDGIMSIKANETFTYNIKANETFGLGAMTLFMNFDENLFEIEKVNNVLDGMTYKFEKGMVALAWSDLNGKSIIDNETLISFNIKAKKSIINPIQIFNYNNQSEFADVNAVVNNGFGLKMSDVQTINNSVFVVNNYPNPAKDFSNIDYILPENAKVRIIVTNVLGQPIATIVDETKEAGSYKNVVDANDLNLSSGIYFFQFEVSGATENYKYIGKMVFER